MQCLTGFEIVILDEHIKCSHRSNAHESFSCPIKKDPLHLFVAFFREFTVPWSLNETMPFCSTFVRAHCRPENLNAL